MALLTDSRRSPRHSMHRKLATFNRARLLPAVPYDVPDEAYRAALCEHEARLLECSFVEHERQRVRAMAATAPTDPEGLTCWFEALKHSGPGQQDALFPWLATRATRAQMTWFLRQEAAGEAGFDDLVALTQVQLPSRPKLELARNYWDEMGRGREHGMHGPMLRRLCEELDIVRDPEEDIVWESLALSNLLIALALNRQYAYQSLGALGVIELTAPGRAAHVNRGLKRLGLQGEARRYFALHATLDVKHSQAWNREVIAPIVAERPERAAWIAEGALMRLHAGARCFATYRHMLGLGTTEPRDSVGAWAT